MRYAATAILAALSCATLFSQSPAPPLEFEVASVKPSAPPEAGRMMMVGRGGRGGPGSTDSTRLNFTNATMMTLVMQAYNVKRYQVTGPTWFDQERFDVIAKIPEGATKEQSNIMLQKLLADRFHLTLHHSSKEFQGYELVVGKNGHKLKDASPEDLAFDPAQQRMAPPPPPPPPGAMNGPPKLDRPGMMMMMKMGRGTPISHLNARAQTIEQLMQMIGSQLNAPLADKTGLTGKYDFTLDYAAELPAGMMAGGMMPLGPPPSGGPAGGPASAADPDELAQSLPTALQQQLGLRLDAKKVQLDTIIVDKADKVPTEN